MYPRKLLSIVVFIFISLFVVSCYSQQNNLVERSQEYKFDFINSLDHCGLEIPHVRFVKIVKDSSDRSIEVIYSVSGSNAKATEQYLMDKIGMKPLVFHCCGWESQPVNLNCENLKDTFPDYYFSIMMNVSAEFMDDDGIPYLEKDWNNIPEFFVVFACNPEP